MNNIKSGTNGTVINGIVTSISREILQELNDNPEGLRAASLMKRIGEPRRTIYNNLNKLRELGLIQNIFPIWQLCHSQSNPLKIAHLLKSNKTQLHDLSFTIRLIKTPGWWDKRQNKFLKLNQIRWGNNSYHQIKKDDFLIQIFTNSMIFICQKKYFGEDSYDCFIKGVQDFLKAYYYVEELFKFRFFPNGIPNVSVRSQHHVYLNDVIAKKCKKEHKKFRLEIDGKLRMWIDMSDPFGMEAGHKNYAPEDLKRYENLVEDVIVNNPPKPSEITSRQDLFDKRMFDVVNVMQGIQENQLIFDKNMQSHIKAIKELGKGMRKFNRLLSERQKKLGDFFG